MTDNHGGHTQDRDSATPASDQTPKLAVIAGATGYLGKHVIHALHHEGWKIRALARDASRLSEVADLIDEVIIGEATNKDSIKGLFDDADVAFSSIGIRHFKRNPTFEEVDYQANSNLVAEAAVAGIKRFVFVSVINADKVRATSPLVDARERVVDELQASSMESVILRPTGFFNDMGDFAKMAAKGRVWMIGSGETKINPIHGADLAQVAVAAMTSPAAASDTEIEIGGPDIYTQRQIGELAFASLNKPAKFSHVNPKLLTLIAKAIGPLNANASALMMMFSSLGTSDAVAPTSGNHHLPDFFNNKI